MRASILVLSLVAACHQDTPPGGGTAGQLRANLGIDLSKVVGFVIAGGATFTTQSAGNDGGASESELYALNADGSLTIVTVVEGPDGGTSSSQTIRPAGIFDTRLYVFFMYWGVTHDGALCDMVAARKADGALYCLPEVGNPGAWESGGEKRAYFKIIQSDAGGHIVWIDHNTRLTRLDLADPDAPTMTQPLGAGPFFATQAVDADGDDLISDGGGPFTRVLKVGGGFFNVADHYVNCLAADGNDLYYLDPVGPTTVDNQWVQLVKSNGSFTPTPLATATRADCSAGLVRAGAHIFLSGVLQEQTNPEPNQLLDVAGGQPRKLLVPGLHQIVRIAGCDQSLFVLGTDASGSGGIVRYDLTTFTTVLPPGDYAVSEMDVAASCEVTFYGQRASDGAYVLGNLAAGSSTPAVIATGLPPVTQIQRIN